MSQHPAVTAPHVASGTEPAPHPNQFALLPALASVGLPSSEWLHLVLLLTAVPLSALALVGGYRAHGRVVPLATGMTGLVALASGLWFASVPAAETAFTVAGSLALAAAHVGNWRRMRNPATPRHAGE